MPFRPPKKQPQFADLKGILAQYKQPDNALYQTVQVLIERLTQFQGIVVDRLDDLDKRMSDVEEGGVEPPLTPTEIIALGYWTSLTDGDEDETDLIFANGECIAVFVPTPEL